MDDTATISQALRIAFAAVNFLVWTGLFLYMLRLGGKLRRLENETTRHDTPTESHEVTT